MSKPLYITIGKVGATFGVQGWLKIQSFTEYGSNILDYSPWYLSRDQVAWTAYQVEASKPHGKIILAKLTGFDTPETARTLTGQTIAILRTQLPALAKNEYYWSDLIGLTVINQQQQILGQVKYLLATGSNDVLVIQGAKEIAIPYLINDVILKVDLDQQTIHVNWEA